MIMRIFHISDLHLGMQLKNYDLYEDQNYVLNQVIQYIKDYQPDCLCIAGDVFDKQIPSLEAIKQYNEFISKIYQVKEDIVVLIISGNHDSGQRIDQYKDLLSHQHLYVNGSLLIQKVVLKDEYGPVNFYLFPFSRPSQIRPFLKEQHDSLSYDQAVHLYLEQLDVDDSQRNVLVSHQFYLPSEKELNSIERADSEVKTVGNIDVIYSDILRQYDYVALGHIHKPMTVKDSYIRYAGSPMAYSISEENQKKQMLMIDLKEKGTTEITSLPLHPLRQVRTITGYYQDVIQETSEDYVRIELLDDQDLNFIDMNEQIRIHYPHVLEITRNVHVDYDMDMDLDTTKIKDPFELICEFIPDMDEQDQKILQDIINEIGGLS